MYVLEITPQDCSWVFSEHGKATTDSQIIYKEPNKVSLVVFTGGHDVWPQLYGEKTGKYTSYNIARDLYESKFFEQARKHNIPCVGICRGSQFLCIKSGGKLVQHSTGHGGCMHLLDTSDGRKILCNSSHHQMQLPPKNAVLLAWSHGRLSERYLDGDNREINVEKECEVVYYPDTNCLGIQYHPEWLQPDHECVKYAQEVVRKYLFNNQLAKTA